MFLPLNCLKCATECFVCLFHNWLGPLGPKSKLSTASTVFRESFQAAKTNQNEHGISRSEDLMFFSLKGKMLRKDTVCAHQCPRDYRHHRQAEGCSGLSKTGTVSAVSVCGQRGQ